MDRFVNEYKKIHGIEKLKSAEVKNVLLYLDLMIDGIIHYHEVKCYNSFLKRVSELNHSLMEHHKEKDIFFAEYIPLLMEIRKDAKLMKKIDRHNYNFYLRRICKVFFNSALTEKIMNEYYFDVY